jgi:hypothetical protein
MRLALPRLVGRLFLGSLALGEFLLEIRSLLGTTAVSRRIGIVCGVGDAFTLDVLFDRLLVLQLLCRVIIDHASPQ